MNTDDKPAPRPDGFVPTRWTLILRARGETPAAQAALSELCHAYYAPVLAFFRIACRNEDAARDLAHEFLARLLARRGLDSVEPGRGRFRSFLLGAAKHFFADQYDRGRAAKRGGGQTMLSVDAGLHPDSRTELQVPDPSCPPSDAIFDREWAQTLVGRALDSLAQEFVAAGKTEQFEALKPCLLGQVESPSQAEIARLLGLSEGAVKVAVHRLRRRFRELVKAEISHTVPETADVQDELRYLVEVLSS